MFVGENACSLDWIDNLVSEIEEAWRFSEFLLSAENLQSDLDQAISSN